MDKARFDVCLAYVIEKSNGARSIARTHYPPSIEAEDERQAKIIAQEALRVRLLKASLLNEGDTLHIVGGTTNPCVG